MRILIALLATLILSEANAQTVILAIGQPDKPTPGQTSPAESPVLKEIAALGPDARLVHAPNLAAASRLLNEGEKVAIVVMLGRSLEEAASNALISGTPGQRAGLSLAQAFPSSSFAQDLSVFFWNCLGKCSQEATVRFQSEFHDTFVSILGKDRAQTLALTSKIGEVVERSTGRRLLRFIVGGMFGISRLAHHITKPVAGFLGTLRVAAWKTIKFAAPINFAMISLSFAPNPLAYVGAGLSLAWFGWFNVAKPLAIRWRGQSVNQCSLLLGL
ncbi:MAG: hypothetical protein ABL958_06685 [Bdellovibrionia bacterium]